MEIGVYTVLGATDIYLVESSDLNVGFKVNNRDGDDYDLSGKLVRFQAKDLEFVSSGVQIVIQDAVKGLGYLILTTANTTDLYRETNYRFDVLEGAKIFPFAWGRIILIPYY